MRRIIFLIAVLVVVGAGAGIGVLGRSWLDDSAPAPRQDAGASAAPSTAASEVAPPPAAAASSGDMVVEVTESDLQSQLDTMLVGRSLGSTPLGEATVQTVTVALRDRQVHVGGNARAGFLQAPFTANGSVAPDANGRPRVNVDEAMVGGVVLPDAARAALGESLQTQVDALFADRAMTVRTIEIADGKMRVVGTARS